MLIFRSTISGTTINSNTNNYLITGTGTANTLQGEANLTFEGTNLSVGTAVTISTAGNMTLDTNEPFSPANMKVCVRSPTRHI